MKIVGLIQARMGSTRLPGKVMAPLAGIPLVGHVWRRLRATRGVEGVVLATTVDPANDPLVAYMADLGVPAYRARGENDIAERLAGAARLANADAILKVNADCPLVDSAVMSLVVDRFRLGDVDYASNKVRWTWPEGLSAEAISREAIEDCDRRLIGAQPREFVANLIRDDRLRYRVASVEGDRDLTMHKLAVDTPDDYALVSRIFDALYLSSPLFGIDAVLTFLASYETEKTT